MGADVTRGDDQSTTVRTGRSALLCATMLAACPVPTEVAAQSVPRANSLGPTASSTPERDALPLPRLRQAIIFDGMPDDAAWDAIDPLPLVQHWPNFLGGVTKPTEIRVAYDDEYLWASGRFYDEPGGVRANSLQRDRWDGDDAFDIIVDSYNDDHTALKFTTTPLGILLDAEILNDAQWTEGIAALNGEWNTFWDARTTRTAEGWFAEVRIPLSSLGFDTDGERVTMGLIAGRYIARTNEKYLFPAIPPDWDMADVKPSQARDVTLQGIEGQAPLWVTPYALAGVDRTREPRTSPVVAPDADVSRDVGLDAKYGLSSNLTLDLTVNTDFAQVESDALQVNLDRFSLFFPEKRQFFQERSSTFTFALGEDNRVFHSRRIGLSPDGRPLTIFGGARLTGRLGSWDVGMLSMQVDGAADSPDENVGALRLRREILGSGKVGGIVTSRIRADGTTDLSIGGDAEIPFGGERVSLQLAHTPNSGQATSSFVDHSSARIFWERRSLQGIGYDASLTYSGATYEPALGFEARHDFTALQTRVAYVWEPDSGGRVDRYRFQTVTRAFWRNVDASVESWLGRVQLLMDLNGGHWANATLNVTREDVDERFALPGATVGRGSYWGANLFGRLETSRARTVAGAVTVWAGQAFDGHRLFLNVQPEVKLSRHFSVGAGYNLHRLWFPDRNQRVDADLADVRMRAALDAKLSAEVFLQYSAAGDAVATNFRVRYRFAEGRDLFVVLDEARDLTDRFGLDSSILGRTDRRLLVKYTWTLQP